MRHEILPHLSHIRRPLILQGSTKFITTLMALSISCKVGLTTKGYNQIHDHDYNDTFAPAKKMTTVQMY